MGVSKPPSKTANTSKKLWRAAFYNAHLSRAAPHRDFSSGFSYASSSSLNPSMGQRQPFRIWLLLTSSLLRQHSSHSQAEAGFSLQPFSCFALFLMQTQSLLCQAGSSPCSCLPITASITRHRATHTSVAMLDLGQDSHDGLDFA